MVSSGLSQGLLIIRDPLVIWIYYLCYAGIISDPITNTLQNAFNG